MTFKNLNAKQINNSIVIKQEIIPNKTSTPISYCRKIGERKLQKMKSESNVIKILLKSSNGNSLLITIPAIISSVNSQINLVSSMISPVINSSANNSQINLPISKLQTSPVNLSIKSSQVPATPSSSENEESSFYDFLAFRNIRRYTTSASDDDFPTLPNEPQDLSIATIQKTAVEEQFKKTAVEEQFKMYILSNNVDGNSEKYIDCTEIMEILMVLLTELFDLGNHPAFKRYKKDSSDPIFDILNNYNDDGKENHDVNKEIINVTPTISKRKRKEKKFSPEYYCEDILSPKTKKIKLENTSSQNKQIFYRPAATPPLHEHKYKPRTTPQKKEPVITDIITPKIKMVKLENTASQNKQIFYQVVATPPFHEHKYKPRVTPEKKEPVIIDDKIVLGPNGTTITVEQFNSINWNSHSIATRKLLTMIFTNDTLATHSLTGKPSPAFIGRERPSKQQLDPQIIHDICCMVISQMPKIEPRHVRAAVTTKCADTAKLYRMNADKQEEQKKLLGEN